MWGFLNVTVGNYGAIALSFALNVILTRRLGAEQFGRLALLLTAVQVLACIIFTWNMNGLIRFGAQEYARRGIVAESFWSRLVVAGPWICFTVTGVVVGQEKVAAYLDISVQALWLVVGYFLLSGLLQAISGVFQACQEMDRYAMTLLFDKAAAFVGLLLAPVPYAHDPVMVLGWYTVSSFLVCVWALVVIGPRLRLPAALSYRAVAEMWSFSAPLIFSTWAGLLGTPWIQYHIIKHYLSDSAVGFYSLASQVSGVVQQVSVIASVLLLPHFSVLVSHCDTVEIRRFVEKIAPYGFLGLALFLCVMLLLGGVGLVLVFGSGFAGATPSLNLLIAATMGLALFNTFMPLLTAYGLTRALTWITVCSSLITLVAAILLVPLIGILGAALATLLGYGSAAIMMMAVVQKRLGLPVFRLGLFAMPVLILLLCKLIGGGVYVYLVSGLVVGIVTVMLVHLFDLFGAEAPRELSCVIPSVRIRAGLARAFWGKLS